MAESLDVIHERMVITRCQAGDAAAFVELVARYQPRLAYFLRKLTGGAEGVDDLLQDVWFDAYRAIGSLADPAAFPAWIYRIARNRACREWRRPVRATSLDEAGEISAPDDDEQFSAEDVQLVHECLDALTDDHRETLVLRCLEDLSYEDIAAVVGCSVGTVRSRLHYAKAALRNEINRRRRA